MGKILVTNDEPDLKIQSNFLTATTRSVHSVIVEHNGMKFRVDDNGGLDDNRAVKTQIIVNFNNNMCQESLDEFLPIFVSSINAFDSGMDQLIKHLNVFADQFDDVTMLKDYIQLIVSKTNKRIKMENLLKMMEDGLLNNHLVSEPAKKLASYII
jgi:hypothetical protein